MTFADFDFGLTAEQEERAARLHDESIVIDMLFQGPVGYRAYTDEMQKVLEETWEATRNAGRVYGDGVLMPIRMALRGEFDEFRETWESSGITAGNRQASIRPAGEALNVHAITTAQFDRFDWLVKALEVADFRSAKAAGKRAGFVSTQSAVDFGELDLLTSAHEFGMRMMGLTYNNQTAVGAGCTERTNAGLSNFGVKVVQRLNELGIIVDTSHDGKQTTLDACRFSSRPVVASHSSAEGLYKVDRAKSDEEIRALAETGGLIGVYAVPFFLAPGTDVTIEAMLDHIDYISQLVGWQHVGIGTDWPLQASKRTLDIAMMPMVMDMGFRPEHNIEPTTNLIGFDDYRDFPNITRGLVKRGYTDEQIQGILGENYLRVFAEVCG